MKVYNHRNEQLATRINTIGAKGPTVKKNVYFINVYFCEATDSLTPPLPGGAKRVERFQRSNGLDTRVLHGPGLGPWAGPGQDSMIFCGPGRVRA